MNSNGYSSALVRAEVVIKSAKIHNRVANIQITRAPFCCDMFGQLSTTRRMRKHTHIQKSHSKTTRNEILCQYQCIYNIP